MSRNLPKQARELIHRLFWKLEVSEAYSLESGRERKFPVTRTYQKLGHVDLTCMMPEMHEDGHNVWWFRPDETTPELIWPVDKSMAQRLSDPGLGWPDGTIQFSRIQTISTAEARVLRASKFSRFMLRRTIGWLQPNNTLYFFQEPLAWVGGKWQESQTKLSHGDLAPKFMSVAARKDNHEAHGNTSMLMSMAFRDRYERKAIITNKHGFSIMMAMSVDTAQQFFKLREVPPEKRRRAALRNWVSSHVRRIDEDRETVVREHLRNRVEFEWAGFHCEYRPSQFDEEANAQLEASKK